MKNDAKFEEELTCRSKIDMGNLTNFDLKSDTKLGEESTCCVFQN